MIKEKNLKLDEDIKLFSDELKKCFSKALDRAVVTKSLVILLPKAEPIIFFESKSRTKAK